MSVTSSELIFCDINQCIKQYFNNFNAKFDAMQSENDKKYQSYRNMHGVSTNCILIRIMIAVMIIIWMICCVYQLINHLLLREMTLLYHSIRITIVSIAYSVVLDKQIKLLSF